MLFQARGGSGDYVWSSDNAEMVSVDKSGEITTLRKGSAVVTAADKRNQLHTGSAQVCFLDYRVYPENGNFKTCTISHILWPAEN